MKPPFRADQVGSLLRPKELSDARKSFKAGNLKEQELKQVENRCIREAIARQEAIGLQSITDGEMRRDWWHMDFMTQLDGVTAVTNPGPVFVGTDEQPPIPSVTGKVGCSKPIMVGDFVFLKQNTKQAAKFTIPSPAMLHLRGGRSSISK
ncbi:MAG TPA: 5-methyltetrahydropteroyltriglutamate--homocysteine S-methyltransferase, partial [Burkholderiales bacterium]|nr:5-methyltetrahydropteroyltriglutamate--homocysteine S-methyltransferase [Burkholderiales bacterium]